MPVNIKDIQRKMQEPNLYVTFFLINVAFIVKHNLWFSRRDISALWWKTLG